MQNFHYMNQQLALEITRKRLELSLKNRKAEYIMNLSISILKM